MAGSKSSEKKRKNYYYSDEEFAQLEEKELAKHRLCLLKDTYDEYRSLYVEFLRRHYLIITLCGVVTLFGVIIACLKIAGKEDLLYSFRTIQAAFAFIIAMGSLIAQGGSIFFPYKKEQLADEFKVPKEEAIRLCIEGDLVTKIEDVVKKLRDKKDLLEQAGTWQSIWATNASIFVLALVGIDFWDILPDFSYMGIGLDVILSLGGLYFMGSNFVLYEILSTSRDTLEHNYFIPVCAFIPYALFVDLFKWSVVFRWDTVRYFLTPWKERQVHWLMDGYFSRDDRLEVLSLLRGLDPKMCHMKVDTFCKELRLNELTPNEPTESTPLLNRLPLLESINDIESQAKRDVIGRYFKLGKGLVECLKDGEPKDPLFPEEKEIIQEFSSIESKTKKHIYVDCFHNKKGFIEYFEKNKQSEVLPAEEIICIAHDALKIYIIFNKIGEDKINRIKTFTASDIGRYTKNEINEIIDAARNNDVRILM